MISKMGRKIFFIHPPKSLKDPYLENVFKNEFEIYLLDSCDQLNVLLQNFSDAIVFINIDMGMGHYDWVEEIKKFQSKFKNVTFTVFSKKESSALQKTLLMDVGIKGGYIHLADDNWKTVELIIQVLEINEARGRRKTVRLDFNKNELRNNISVKISTKKGYLIQGTVLSFSSAGLLVQLTKGQLNQDDSIEDVIFKLKDHELHVNGSLLKRFDNGNFFITFENISPDDKDYIQSYIFEHLQYSFKNLLTRLK